ncbi:MAG TPA: 4'-phosphopantetheinyl transferase superfamily protein [Pyrinomonadaceae bacterium]|nr:4'-phosphopantetheinyl transferase superfamily protein [Pyrinomonadaceae bacterium]
MWRTRLEQPPERVDAFLHTLDDEERARAGRFHFDKHRRHFVVGRGVLRLLLSRYLETRPEDVRFHYGSHGKPLLDGEHRANSLRFNASHSGDLALYAFVQDYEVGVDVEYIKQDFSTEEIAERFFSSHEIETITSLEKPDRPAAFFRLWTRKEAYIKAIGTGLSHPLNTFDVTAPIPGWSIFDLDVGSDYSAALAVDGLVHGLNGFDLKSA